MVQKCTSLAVESENTDSLDNRNVNNASPTPSATFSEDASTINDGACSSSQSEASNTELESKVDQEVRSFYVFCFGSTNNNLFDKKQIGDTDQSYFRQTNMLVIQL